MASLFWMAQSRAYQLPSALIVPLFMEQLLAVLVGVADTFMVSYAGEAAVSGVSLVNMFNTIFIYLFSALAAGGAIVVSQYITAMGLAFVTVTGQCIGSGDKEAVEYYMRKLLKLTFAVSVIWNGMILAVTPLVLKGYALSAEAAELVLVLVLIHNLFNAVCFPLSGALSNGLRAAGDVKFTMYVSLISTVAGRVLFSVIFAVWMNMGVIGVALAMCLDWGIRAVVFWIRFVKGSWKKFSVI